jgi:hypothetical protein
VTNKPSLRDVAKQANVSLGTVSNVLNRPTSVSEETRKKVRRRISFCRGFPIEKRLRAPNSCGIGKQPLGRKVDLAMCFSFELFNEQAVIS